jgi:D-sedoheptulose 7-phosphate isomerase
MDRAENVKRFLDDYKSRLFTLIESIDYDTFDKVMTQIIHTFKNGNTLYVSGNGGSAATASHMQADFQFFVRYHTSFRPKIMALTDNIPLLTAISNDMSYKDVFSEQLKGRFTKNDTLIVISASGNSENVIEAVKYAKEVGGKTIGMIGFSGGKLKDLVDYALFNPNEDKDYGTIEDLHMIYDHMMVNYLCADPEFLAIK